MARRRDLGLLAGVSACFLLSGFAALLYQTAWLRQFSIVFGTSELAVAAVLAAYMGGLGTGAAVAGRFLGRIRRPILVYGLLEGGVALSACAYRPYSMGRVGCTSRLWAGCWSCRRAVAWHGRFTTSSSVS